MRSNFTIEGPLSEDVPADVCLSNSSGNLTQCPPQTDDFVSTTAYSPSLTDAYQSYENGTSEDEITVDLGESSVFLLVILISKWILSPFVVTANVMTVVVVIKYIKKMTPTHVVIALLSFSGLLLGIIIHPFNLVLYFTGDTVHAEHLCDFLTWVKFVAVGLNFGAALLIAIERCVLVTSFKLHRKFLTVKRQVYLCIAFSVCLLISATIYTLMVDSGLRFGDCYAILKMSHLKSRLRLILYILIMTPFALVTCCIAYCYLRICHFIWKQRKALKSSQNSSCSNNFQKEKKTTITIAIILTVYFVGKGPAFFYQLMTMNDVVHWKIELYDFFGLLWYITALADSFIYAWKVPEFKDGYRRILCCLRRSRIIQVVPLPNAQPPVNNVPLEPRREI